MRPEIKRSLVAVLEIWIRPVGLIWPGWHDQGTFGVFSLVPAFLRSRLQKPGAYSGTHHFELEREEIFIPCFFVMIKRFGDGRDWFFEKRFGLFVHWGLYAIPAWHEQVLWRTRMTRKAYEQLAIEFNPTKFDPEAWLDQLQEAGMQYLCFTTKHHDGFCMWDTAYTEYKITRTPYGRERSWQAGRRPAPIAEFLWDSTTPCRIGITPMRQIGDATTK